jgi:putative zinc finger/helix-turn-helix YgiT family protein
MKEKMECAECEYPHELKGKRIVHKYKESGLEYITLAGITEYKCPQCGAVYLQIPKLKQLHSLIADMIMRKEATLTGKEVRFLRKQLGYSTEQFGKLLSYDPKTLSRIENGAQKISGTFDRLVRMAYASGRRDLNYNLHDFLMGNGIRYKRLELAFQRGEDWEVKEKAA